jgi:hypothetical protein
MTEQDERFALLESIDDQAFDLVENSIRKRFIEKQARNLAEGYNLVPSINNAERIVILPDTVETKPDNLIVGAMAILARRLGYDVRKLPYGERKIKDLTPSQWKEAAGIAFAPLDLERKILVKEKKDRYEHGRVIARAQATIGVFQSTEWLGLEALKKSHTWFGNNPNEVIGTGRVKLKAIYTGNELSQYFIEEEWKDELSTVLGQLLRKAHSLMPSDVQQHIISENVLSFSECVVLFGKTRITTSPAQGKRSAVTQERVPKKPRQNALMLPEEMKLFDELASLLFAGIDIGNKETYIETLSTMTFAKLKLKLRKNATDRAACLTKFAAMTTKRLNAIRKAESNQTKRKRDVTPTDVISMLRRRISPISDLVSEMVFIDPNFEGLLRSCKVLNINGELDSFESRRRLETKVISVVMPKYLELEIRQQTIDIDIDTPAEKEKEPGAGQKPAPGPSNTKPEAALKASTLAIVKDERRHKFVRENIHRFWNAGKIKSTSVLDLLVTKLSAEANKQRNNQLNEQERIALADEVFKTHVGVR